MQVSRFSGRRVLLTEERLNSNSRVAFDHQIVIIIIKIVNIECSSMKMEYSSMNVESISYHLHLCHFH